jgi:phytoene/squalene synthetase
MMNDIKSDLAPSITKAASKQTYYTIRLLADRARVADAYRAYAYFRWVDDVLDGGTDEYFERRGNFIFVRSVFHHQIQRLADRAMPIAFG